MNALKALLCLFGACGALVLGAQPAPEARPRELVLNGQTFSLVHSRQGAGSYVREVKTASLGFARVETIADIQRCYEFRISIETAAAALAAARRDAGALEELGTALSLMDAATDSLTHREDADYASTSRWRGPRTTSTSRPRCGRCASISTSA